MNWIYEKNPLIIYIADPMCSWCYGFAPVISEIKKQYADHEFRLVQGGLRPGGTDKMSEMKDMLAHHWKEVQKRTKQTFDFSAFDYSDRTLDTEPGARAVITARMLNVNDEYAFFVRVQEAFFAQAKDMTESDTFVEIAKEFDLDPHLFLKTFESDEARYSTRADFQLSSEMGIKGFPSVVIRHNGELFLAANGYRGYDDLNQVIQNIQSEKR